MFREWRVFQNSPTPGIFALGTNKGIIIEWGGKAPPSLPLRDSYQYRAGPNTGTNVRLAH
jgi:hypothetical protein